MDPCDPKLEDVVIFDPVVLDNSEAEASLERDDTSQLKAYLGGVPISVRSSSDWDV